MIKSSESSLFITDDSSRFINQQPFWNYIGTKSNVPCAPLTISKCKDINSRGKNIFIIVTVFYFLYYTHLKHNDIES